MDAPWICLSAVFALFAVCALVVGRAEDIARRIK